MHYRLIHKFVFVLIFSTILGMSFFMTSTHLFSDPEKMTLAALGDCIISRKVSVSKDLEFLELVKLIRSADCTWANCELPIVDIEKAYPQYREQDIPGAAEPWCADELKWIGIDTVGFANNHTMDFGFEGLFSTWENLERVGISHAGTGYDLNQASRPGYVDSPGGRVGQISCASAIHPGTHASFPTPYLRGRPGLNPLRLEDTVHLKKESYEAIKRISKELTGLFKDEQEKDKKLKGSLKKGKRDSTDKKKTVEQLKLFNTTILPGDATAYSWTINPEDLARITDSIKIARRNSRIVIVSMHAHRGDYSSKAPAEFLEIFARACIDAGADVVFNTGPHQLWGIEIYKNKPIFYSLGNFLFQISTENAIPSETYAMLGFEPHTRDTSIAMEKVNKLFFDEKCYWQSVVPIITFDKGNDINSIKLYPISLGKDKAAYEQGTPFLPEKGEGKHIIEGLAELSTPYNTKIEYRDGVGFIRLK